MVVVRLAGWETPGTHGQAAEEEDRQCEKKTDVEGEELSLDVNCLIAETRVKVTQAARAAH